MMVEDGEPPASAPFEGPEKLLEIWFAPSVSLVQGQGLRGVERSVWEEMLSIVKCQVLSVVHGKHIDAYLLSESSLFIWAHKLILKTCGTTLNLLGLPRILSIAASQCGLSQVHRCFYSRKSFMFPERQLGPHKEWRDEVDFLDKLFEERQMSGAAYTVGKVNGDHWLLWLCSTPEDGPEPTSPSPNGTQGEGEKVAIPGELDYTIEILMSKLGASAREPFYGTYVSTHPLGPTEPSTPSSRAQALSQELGISSLFPSPDNTLDAYSFDPCGYSANALLRFEPSGIHEAAASSREHEGYWTIHVTPEVECSYASFECNVPMSTTPSQADSGTAVPSLQTLIQRVVDIFQPGHLSLTLFVSSSQVDERDIVEEAQRAFKAALVGQRGYKRTDKINYEFGGYDLAFASYTRP